MRQLVPVVGSMEAAVDDIVDLFLGANHPIEQHLVGFGLVELTPDSVEHQSASPVKRVKTDVEKLTVPFGFLTLVDDLEGEVIFGRQPPSLLTDAFGVDILAEVLIEVVLNHPQGH